MANNSENLPFLTGGQLGMLLSWPAAVEVLRRAVLARESQGIGNDALRTSFATRAGEILLMPAEAGDFAGVKLVSVNDGRSGRDVPRIQGLYVLFDSATLTPVGLLDGVVLTQIRTAAMSALAVDHLAVPKAERLVVVGSGRQAYGHVHSISAVRPIREVRVLGRTAGGVAELVRRLRAENVPAEVGTSDDLRRADIVACCTTARTPLFDSASLAADATVVAVGSHRPDAREVDTRLVATATVVVESMTSAMAEAGDILLAIADGVPERDAIDGTLVELVTGRLVADPLAPRLFKSVGEAWADLAIAAAAFRGGVPG